MSSISANVSPTDPNASTKSNQYHEKHQAANPNRDVGDTDDAPNEELESLEKTDDNNLADHPDEVDNDTETSEQQ